MLEGSQAALCVHDQQTGTRSWHVILRDGVKFKDVPTHVNELIHKKIPEK
jgi:hypothetical protein